MNWRDRLIAAIIHLIATLLIAGLAAALIFGVWYPNAYAEMVGGFKLFVLLIGCDLVLGPLISLVIYNIKKSRRELVRDYFVVGILQLTALIYGVSVVAQSRPVFVIFTKDRFEVVTAQELIGSDLRMGGSYEFRTLSWSGPRLAGIQFPVNIDERNDLLFSAVLGKDVQLMPKYYRSYDSKLDEIKQKGMALSVLIGKNEEVKNQVSSAVKSLKVSENALRWLPVHHRFGFWTVLIDSNTGYPVKYLPIDPY